MTCIHDYEIMEYFHCSQNPLGSAYSNFPLAPSNHWSFYCLHILPFPECHTVGIIQRVAFSDWLFSLRNMYLSFLHVSSCLDNAFLFSFSFFPLFWPSHGIWSSLDRDQICSCCNARSLIHSARLGIEPVSQRSQDTSANSNNSFLFNLNNISLSGWTWVYLFIHLLKDTLFASKLE